MTEPTPVNPRVLSTKQIVAQVIGFVIGAVLLAWCISIAVRQGDWSKVADADPLLIVGLAGFSIVSLAVNGTIFWLVIRPVQHVRFDHMQWLNLVTTVLNYAPIRAGLIARVVYHLRVDRMTLLQVGAWFAAIGATMMIALGSVVAATIVRPELDWLWVGLALGMVGLAGMMLGAMMGRPVIVKYGRGMDLMLRRPSCLWGALALRLVDIFAYAGRMGCAVAIVGLDFTGTDILLLAIADIALNLNPLGRVGFREVGVALFAGYLGMSGAELDAATSQLGLINSAGEALVGIPLGSIALLWYRKRWVQARENGETSKRPNVETTEE